jgi:sec-independent protein translocase protein TatC
MTTTTTTTPTTPPSPSTAPEPPADAFDGGRPMTILEHLQELRTRLIWCCAGLVIGVSVGLVFTNPFLDVLVAPVKHIPPRADGSRVELIFTDPLESFTVYFKVGLLGGLILAMPVFVYEALMFVLPGLTPQEQRWVLPIVGGVFACFIIGVLFAYYVTLPPAATFLLTFNDTRVKAFINIGKYINFATRLLFWVGVTFETPLVILALARFGVITGRQLLGWWRYVIVLMFVVAAVVTPTPDPLTQTLVAVPLLLLYFIGVGLAFLFGRDQRRPRRVR